MSLAEVYEKTKLKQSEQATKKQQLIEDLKKDLLLMETKLENLTKKLEALTMHVQTIETTKVDDIIKSHKTLKQVHNDTSKAWNLTMTELSAVVMDLGRRVTELEL